MKLFDNKGKLWVVLLAVSLIMAGCSGGSGGSNGGEGGAPGDPALKTGVFLDSAVEGLNYKTDTQTGVTKASGVFWYREGETVTFSIGEAVIGQTAAKAQVTPLDLVSGASDETDPKVTNICRLLQSLDRDGKPENGIQIPQQIKDVIKKHPVDLNLSTLGFETSPAVKNLLGELNGLSVFTDQSERVLRTPDQARTHFRETLRSLNPEYVAPPKEVRALTAGEQTLVQSDNGFGLRLFKEIVATQKDKNVFISPLSISMALGMTLNGANGATQQAMQTTLELGGQTLPEINGAYQSLLDLLTNLDPKVTFQIANSIWYRQGFPVEKEFIDLNKTYFNAEVNALDFASPQAPATINAWVNKSTHGKIPTIVDQIGRDIVMFLINAIYFKGAWSSRFDAAHTKDDWFTLPDGSRKPCKMMHQTAGYKYLTNDDFQAIDLPYGDGDFSMTIFLPNAGKNVDDLITNLNQANWQEWIQTLSAKNAHGVSLYLPKFTLEYDLTLNDMLKALGMEIAFDPWQADFTRIRKEGGLYIDGVKHKTYVEVNEEGTVAAAVTSVEVGITSIIMPPVVRIDRPFIFAIRETRSQTILFMGKIVEPILP